MLSEHLIFMYFNNRSFIGELVSLYLFDIVKSFDMFLNHWPDLNLDWHTKVLTDTRQQNSLNF